MTVHLDIIWEVFKNGQQTNVYSNFADFFKSLRVHFALLNLLVLSVETIQYSVSVHLD